MGVGLDIGANTFDEKARWLFMATRTSMGFCMVDDCVRTSVKNKYHVVLSVFSFQSFFTVHLKKKSHLGGWWKYGSWVLTCCLTMGHAGELGRALAVAPGEVVFRLAFWIPPFCWDGSATQTCESPGPLGLAERRVMAPPPTLGSLL